MLRFSLISLILIISVSFNNISYAFEGSYNINSYIGSEANIRKMKLKKNFGDKAFQDPYYGELNFFIGCKINENFGIEAGYEFSETKVQSKIAKNGSFLFGYQLHDKISGIDNITNFFHSRSKINGFNINLVGFLPINFEKSISLIGSMGLGYIKNHIVCDLSEVVEKSINIFDNENIPIQKFSLSRSKYKKHTSTIRLNYGIQYVRNNNFGIRALIGWENTHKIKIQGKCIDVIKKVNEHAKFKDSLTFRIGFFVPF